MFIVEKWKIQTHRHLYINHPWAAWLLRQMSKHTVPTPILKCAVIPTLCTLRDNNSDFQGSELSTTASKMGRSTGQR